jgi:hypothetical protein
MTVEIAGQTTMTNTGAERNNDKSLIDKNFDFHGCEVFNEMQKYAIISTYSGVNDVFYEKKY